MTEPTPPVARVPRGRALAWVFVLSLSLAIVIAGGLALQMALGRDPALGPKRVAAAAPAADPAAAVVAPVDPAPAVAPAPAPAPVQSTPS